MRGTDYRTVDGRAQMDVVCHALAQRIEPLDTPEVRQRYRDRDIPRAEAVRDIDRRYRFDLFYASRSHHLLPEDMTDARLETLLKRIVRPLGEPA